MFMISWDCQCKFYSRTCNSNQKLNVSIKNIVRIKKNVFCGYSKYFKIIVDGSDFDYIDILLDENQIKIVSYMTFCTKDYWLVQNLSTLCLIKWMGLLEVIVKLNYWHYLILKNIMQFSAGLDIF